jgi:hypothetical protein
VRYQYCISIFLKDAKAVLLLLMLLLHFYDTASAQQEKIELLFIDSLSLQPLENVVIYSNGLEKGRSDKTGYLLITDSTIRKAIAIKDGYGQHTSSDIRNESVIKLRPLSQNLKEVVVTNNRTSRVSKDNREYIIDYQLEGDNILIATRYLGNKRNHLKLISLTGNTIYDTTIGEEPISLFKACNNKTYLLTANKLYPLSINNNITLEKPISKNLYNRIRECEHYYNDVYYYKLTNKENFRVSFCYAARNDTALHPFINLDMPEVAKASQEEYWEILQLLAFGNDKKASHKARLRYLWDKNSFKVIDVPLIRIQDQFIVFDFERKQIMQYDTKGVLTKETGMQFPIGKIMNIALITDNVTNKVYLYKRNLQTLEEVDIHTGTTRGNRILLDKATAENVKIHDSHIYYLWQDAANIMTKQLYTQVLR